MKTYLVTGGCGFIGSHLAEALLAAGHGVRVLDDLSSGSIANLPPGAAFTQGDVADPAWVRDALAGVDGCFHLAAIASVERGTSDWTGAHRVNQTGTVALLDAVRRCGRLIPFVYASSAAVYGNCQSLPLTEASPARPLSAYGADKLGCELHARVASASFGIPTTGLRLFNVFGPRQDPRSPYSGVISRFCDRLSRGEPITIHGNGEQCRDFIFVRDVVAALMAAMSGAGQDARVFNVCTGRQTSVLDLATIIGSLTGGRLDLRFAPARLGDIQYSVGSPQKARAVLDLADPTPLKEGLSMVLDWSARHTRAAKVG